MVECNLAKVEVAGSNPVSRSTKESISLKVAPEKVRCKLGANFSGVFSSGIHSLPSEISIPPHRRMKRLGEYSHRWAWWACSVGSAVPAR